MARLLKLTAKPRMQGEDVKRAQQLLNLEGAALTEDGVFGPATAAAVKSFQRAKGLTADGIIGEKTWAALEALSPAAPETEPSLPLGLVAHCYGHLGDIYVWGGDGETAISESWIRKKETSENNAQRAIRFWQAQRAAGVTELAAFDCSGLISAYLEARGLVSSKRNSDHLWDLSRAVSRGELEAGDLLFRAKDGDAYHVGVYAGKGRVIEAMGRDQGVVIRGIDASGSGYWTHARRLTLS